MIKALISGIILLIILLPFIARMLQKLDYYFWLFLNLYFDPGGYVSGFMSGNLIGIFNITDVCFFFIVVFFMSNKVNRKIIYHDQYFMKFVKWLLVFSLYYFIFYGGIVPSMNNDLNYLTFLVKSRTFIYGIVILLSVYVFSLRGLLYFYKTTLFFAVVCLGLFWMSLITGIQLSYVWEFERYPGFGMQRIAMLSYGMFNLVFPLALTGFLLSRNKRMPIESKRWLYFSGILMLLTLLITLSRREIINVIGTFAILVFLVAILSRKPLPSSIVKILIPAFLAIVFLNFTMPEKISDISKIGEDTYSLLTTGKDSRGLSDYRISGDGDLKLAKEIIKKNMWIGTGYTYMYFPDNDFSASPRGTSYIVAADAAGEVPIYYVLFGFGIIGAILLIPLYYAIVKLFFRIFYVLKQNFANLTEDLLTLAITIYLLYIIAAMFTLSIYSLGSQFLAHTIGYSAVNIGLGFSLYRNHYSKYSAS